MDSGNTSNQASTSSSGDARKKAKNYYNLLTLFFLVNQVIFLTNDEVIEDDLAIGIFITCLILTFIVLTIKGSNSAKWILSVLLIPLGVALLYAGFESPSLNFKLTGLYYIFFGLIVHISKRLKPITILELPEITNQDEKIEELEHIVVEGKSFSFPSSFERNMATLIDIIFFFMLIGLLATDH